MPVDPSVTTVLKRVADQLGDDQTALATWNRDYYRNHRARYISDVETVAEHYRDGEILEIASGPCHLTAVLVTLGYRVVGVDLAPERFRSFIKDNGLKVVRCDIERDPLPFEDGSFRLVLFNEIFEHLRIDPIHAMRELHRVLHADGTLILTTPNLYYLRRVVSFLRGRGICLPYTEFEKIHTLGHMGHVREYARREVTDFLTRVGLRVRSTRYRCYEHSKDAKGLLERLAVSLFPPLSPYQVFVCEKAI